MYLRDKAFSRKNGLDGCIMMHTGEKLFKYSYGKNTLSCKVDLVWYGMLKTVEKPYQCINFDVAISQKNSYQPSERTHWGEIISIQPLWQVFIIKHMFC